MKKKLWISDEAIKLKGIEYFYNCDVDDFVHDIGSYVDGLIITQDDMCDIYVSVSDDDTSYNDVVDL